MTMASASAAAVAMLVQALLMVLIFSNLFVGAASGGLAVVAAVKGAKPIYRWFGMPLEREAEGRKPRGGGERAWPPRHEAPYYDDPISWVTR